MENQIVVVAGIISNRDQFLIVQRSLDPSDLQPGLWEFPGGKVKYGESPEKALIREINEELAIPIHTLDIYDVTSGMFDDIHAIMILYHCKTDTRDIDLRVGSDYSWISPAQLAEFKFAKLDIPVVRRMITELSE